MNATAIGVAAVAALLTTTLPAHAQSEKDVQEVIQEFQKGDPGMKSWFRSLGMPCSLPWARAPSGLAAPMVRAGLRAAACRLGRPP